MAINEISGTAWASISEYSGTAVASISEVSGEAAPAGGGAPTFRSAAEVYDTTSSNDTCTIDKPSGVVEGDLLIAVIYFNGGTESISSDDGFTEIDENIHTNLTSTSACYYKIAGASEPSTYSWTYGTTDSRTSGVVAAFEGSFTGNPESETVSFDESVTGNDITTDEDDSIVVYFGGFDEPAGGTWSEPTSWASAGADDGSNNSYIGYFEKATAGATGTIGYTLSASQSRAFNHMWAFYSNN